MPRLHHGSDERTAIKELPFGNGFCGALRLLRDLAKPRDPTESGIYSLGDRIKLCKIPILNKIGGFSSLKCYRSKFYKFCEVPKQILLNRSIAFSSRKRERKQRASYREVFGNPWLCICWREKRKEAKSQLQEGLRKLLAVHLLERKVKRDRDPVTGGSSETSGCDLLKGKWRKAESSAAVSTGDSSSFGGQEKWRWRGVEKACF
ncbi:MAG: hypothetical protein GY820_10855 [Gammaproteobacteria bacterium]|nr:hypothetical protein [Gammaproteobacteria bacterium]